MCVYNKRKIHYQTIQKPPYPHTTNTLYFLILSHTPISPPSKPLYLLPKEFSCPRPPIALPRAPPRPWWVMREAGKDACCEGEDGWGRPLLPPLYVPWDAWLDHVEEPPLGKPPLLLQWLFYCIIIFLGLGRCPIIILLCSN